MILYNIDVVFNGNILFKSKNVYEILFDNIDSLIFIIANNLNNLKI